MKKGNNIVFLLNSSFPYYSGGRETWLYNISKRLTKNGYSVTIITKRNPGRNLHFRDISEKIETIPCKTLLNIPILKHLIHSYLKIIDSTVLSLQMARKIKNRFGNNYQSCVFISMDTVYTAFAIRIMKAKYQDLNFVCSNRSLHAAILSDKYPIFRHFFYYMEKRAYKSADEIWANGKDTKAYIKHCGFDSVLIGNGVDIEGIDQEERTPEEAVFMKSNFKITMLATLLDRKGIKELLEAGSILVKNGIADFNLIFIGKGSPDHYREYADKFKISDRVFFLGEKKNVASYLKNSDLIACLNSGGGMSMSALEGLASRTPVIAWNSPVYTQLIEHQVNGVLVKEKNTQELANAIYSIKNNYSKYKKMGTEARERVEAFDWEKITQRVIFQLERILNK